jgi:L-threonylcarbamoyladenylate synthase
MQVFRSLNDPHIPRLLQNGAVGVIPSDTLYGIVASMAHEAAVERLFGLRKRDSNKPCIVLIGDRSQITDTAGWHSADWRVTEHYWPGPFSIIVPTTAKTPAYLHRGGTTLAYRLPAYSALQAMLQQAGPVIAPTANVQGEPPATTIEEAERYFGNSVDFYVDAGKLAGEPSTLMKVENDRIRILRQGAGKLTPADLQTALGPNHR